MNLTELAGIGGQLNVSTDSNVLSMRNALDQQAAQEDTSRQAIAAVTATKGMERSVLPHLGGKIDILA
jgi:hypothetical protein